MHGRKLLCFFFFRDKRAGTGFLVIVTKLKARVPSVCVTNITSRIIEVLKRQMLVARNLALMLADVAALSHASMKVLPELCLVRVKSVV